MQLWGMQLVAIVEDYSLSHYSLRHYSLSHYSLTLGAVSDSPSIRLASLVLFNILGGPHHRRRLSLFELQGVLPRGCCPRLGINNNRVFLPLNGL